MNFVQQLEESLRDLAAEARKKHPGVKEASERATLKLRQLKNSYVVAVRHASKTPDAAHPKTSLFQSSELLHPFLLAANYPNASARLLEISFRAMRLILEADALVPSDGLHLVRVWMIQAHVVVAYYQKQYPAKGAASAGNGIDASQRGSTHFSVAAESDGGIAASTTSGGGSGWFGWTSTKALANEAETAGAAIKNAVSSSTGQTGSSFQSSKDMEKLALDLLSCLLQLLEGLRRYPEHLSTEVWTNALALACLWLSPLPPRHTVRQAAHSTVSQLVSLLYTPLTGGEDDTLRQEAHILLLRDTWEDLLLMAQSPVDMTSPFGGAFTLCRGKGASRTPIPVPPSPNFALEIMTRLWRDHLAQSNDPIWVGVFAENDTDENDEPNELIAKSISCTETWLNEIASPTCTIERTNRIVQWSVLVLQSQSLNYPARCRDLIPPLTQSISLATEACRGRHEFEDGFVYNGDAKNSAKREPKSTQGSVGAPSQSYFPTTLLWKAGLILEALYRVLENEFNTYVTMLSDRATMGCLTEALSDFSTIGASCQEHMIQLIGFCDSSNAQQHSLQPTIARRTEQAISAGTIVDENRSETKKGVASNATVPPNLLGESLWMGMYGIVRVAQSLSASDNAVDLVEETFAACLAVLQHFLKRFPGSPNLVEMSLRGYSSLADACFSLHGTAMQRKALLSSLCKLSLPSWGKHDPSSQLQNHHIPCLLTLLGIVHKHFEDIPSEWDLILWTFEELSVMSIASVKLSEEAYHGALAITAIFGRFGPFSTCFSVDCLLKFVDALTQIVQVLMEDRDLLGESVMIPHERANSESTSKTSPSKDQSLSRQIMSIGVRAIYGGQSSKTGSNVSDSSEINERTKGSFYEEYRQDFVKRITTSKSTVRVGAIGRLPFSLSLLIDVAMANSFRYAKCGERVSGKLSALAAASPSVRPFLMDIIAMLTMSHISEGGPSPAPFVGPAKIAIQDPTQSQLLAVESITQSDARKATAKLKPVAQTDLLGPLCETIRTTEKAEVAEAALGTLNAVLETAGHNLTGGVWIVLIAAVASLSGDPTYGISRSSQAWATSCLNAFKCLKLIASDFQDQLRTEIGARSALLNCCFAFGSSRHDVNTSLTAIGLLWTIADKDSDSSSSSIQEALSKLVQLSSDSRAEVRNAAINTLFSCIVGRGASFSDKQWESFFVDTVFVVYRGVETAKKSNQPPQQPATATPSSRYKLSRHHSQDSEGKQWLSSQVIVLRGLVRVLRNFFPLLLSTSNASSKRKDNNAVPWFQDCWVQILDFAYEASAISGDRETLDIRTVGVELLAVSCQLSSKAGISAAIAPARVGTHMEVVNGALRSVRESKTQSGKDIGEVKRTETEEELRRNIFLESFESLESYIELHENFVGKGKEMSDVHLQVLHKFCAGLSQVFECCRRDELSNDQRQKSILFLESLLGEATLIEKDDDLERRFVQMVKSAIQMSTVNLTARFLNQAQRASLELLKNMAMDGSVEAFRALLKISGDANFSRMESDEDESESGAVTGTDPKLLASEASGDLCHAISEGKACCECRIYVFYMVTCLLKSPGSGNGTKGKSDPRKRPSYKRILPVFVAGFDAVGEMNAVMKKNDSGRLQKIAHDVVLEFCSVLEQLLTPIHTREKLERIRRAQDLVVIIQALSERAPDGYIDLFCSVLSSGAMSSLKTAVLHDEFEISHQDSDLLTKSKEHRSELLSLFRACLVGLCSLKPQYPDLLEVVKDALHDTLEAIEKGPTGSVRLKIGLGICEDICQFGESLPTLITGIFPLLCRLIVSDNGSVRESANRVFETAKVGDLLEIHRTRADRIAEEAEREKSALRRRIDDLENQNVKLRQDLAVLEASAAL
mmetsp:Transcript_9663/g.19508  ORF Transcript_9663/g.19508 Transcript_9663/m.19508 type:complete len:1861 (-) Transcript_9663:2136-7718(-)|eukprot:scaffold7349_cov173-Amphora_coffeaeformis.AAC.2